MTTVVLADDHTVVRDGLRVLLEAQSDISVVGDAANGREAVRLALQLHPDVVVMDIAMPELTGIEATQQTRAYLPSAAGRRAGLPAEGLGRHRGRRRGSGRACRPALPQSEDRVHRD